MDLLHLQWVSLPVRVLENFPFYAVRGLVILCQMFAPRSQALSPAKAARTKRRDGSLPMHCALRWWPHTIADREPDRTFFDCGAFCMGNALQQCITETHMRKLTLLAATLLLASTAV